MTPDEGERMDAAAEDFDRNGEHVGWWACDGDEWVCAPTCLAPSGHDWMDEIAPSNGSSSSSLGGCSE